MSKAGEFVRAGCIGPIAPEIGWAPPLRYLLRRDRVLQAIRKNSVGSYLEIGCGAGALADELDYDGWRVMGIESSPQALCMAIALKELSGGKQVLASSLSEAEDSTWDIVAALDVLEHIEDDKAAIHSWAMKIRPGGHLLLAVPAHPARWGAGDVWAGHYRRYSLVDLVALTRSAGLEPVYQECYGFPFANLSEMLGEFYYRRRLVDSQGESKAAATSKSGIDRRMATRLSSLISSRVGLLGMRIAYWAQAVTANRSWGSGYIVLARHR